MHNKALCSFLILCLLPFIAPPAHGEAAAADGASALSPQTENVNDPSKAYQQSYLLEAEARYEEALKALQALEGSDGNTYFYQLRLGWLAYQTGDYSLSGAAYQKAVALAPASVEARLGLLLPQMAQRLFSRAEKTALEILARDKNNYLANLRLASVYYQSGKYEAAGERYEKLMGLYPGDLVAATGLGWCRLKQRSRREAGNLFRSVLRVAPSYEEAQTGLEELGKGN